MRDKIFISHAAPEDNEFSRWLALQLIKLGYPVWCDLIKLKGGEDFWRDIERAIRERTVKFLYVLSSTSNVKEGVLKELAVAQRTAKTENLKDFVIPLRIDNLSDSEINIEISRLNTISFEHGWASGLKALQDKLIEDGISTSSDFTPDIVTSWWREQFSADRGIIQREEELLSSWFSLETRPQDIYYHLAWDAPMAQQNTPAEPKHPIYPYKNGFLSFVPREEFPQVSINGYEYIVVDSHRLKISDLFEGKHEPHFMYAKTARNAVVNLLDQTWRKEMERRGLHAYELANKNWCYYFSKGQLDKDKINFTGVSGEKKKRAIIGYRKFKRLDGSFRLRHWHFAVSARSHLFPTLAFSLRTHVLFSDDGENIWESDSRLHKARMSQCKDWWNDDWRDRLLAVMEWLAAGKKNIEISLTGDEILSVAIRPMTVTSPVMYDPGATAGNMEQVIQEKSDDDEDGEIVEDEYDGEDEEVE